MFTAEQWLSGNTPSLLSSYKAMTSLVTINQTLTKCKSSTRLAMSWPLFEFFTVRDHISGFPSMQFFTLKGLIFYALYTVSLVILYCWGAPEGRTPVVFLGRCLEHWVYFLALTSLGQFSARPWNSLLSCQRCCELWLGSWVFPIVLFSVSHTKKYGQSKVFPVSLRQEELRRILLEARTMSWFLQPQ